MSAVKKHKNPLSFIIKSLIIILIISATALVFLNRQFIFDQITVWRFQPKSGVVELVDRAGMNDYGKFLYLASQPALDSPSAFNKACARVESTTSILGCYNNGNIYIYNVTDSQLDGVREVTATHETLHAAYVRLNPDEKQKVDALLENEYQKLSVDKSFQEKMAFYDRTEAGQRDNELHSVIGTEVQTIDPNLESYYSKYFSDRQKVVTLNNKYISVFKELDTKANNLKTQMDNLASSISARSDQYNSDIKVLNADIASFNNRANNNQFYSQSQFNQERSSLVYRISLVEAQRASINNDIESYNELLAEYNSIATQSQELYKSIDSTLAPAPSI